MAEPEDKESEPDHAECLRIPLTRQGSNAMTQDGC